MERNHDFFSRLNAQILTVDIALSLVQVSHTSVLCGEPVFCFKNIEASTGESINGG